MFKSCKGDEYKVMKEFIYQSFLNKLDDIDNIINLIDSLDIKDKIAFLEKLMKKCKFTKEEYYSNNENQKILIICELNEKGKLKIADESNCYSDIKKILEEIRKDLEGEIGIKKLAEFLDNEEKIVIKRLRLIKIINIDFGPEKIYKDFKNIIKEIKEDIKELTMIKNSLLIFHRNKYQTIIKEILNIIQGIQEKNLDSYNIEKTKIENLKKYKIKDVEKLKDFMFFKVLYSKEYERNQDIEESFEKAKKKLDVFEASFLEEDSAEEVYENNKDIFNKIKEILSNDESKAEQFLNQMIEYF